METRDPLYRLTWHGLTTASLLALANTPAGAQSMVQTPTNVPGISVVAAPPAGFDPATATAMVNGQFDLPPRPDETVAPVAYAAWKTAVMAAQNREVPALEATNISQGPIKGKQVSSGQGQAAESAENNIISATSNNWSGTSVVNGTTSNVEAIIGLFVVPTAHQAFGACTGGWDWSSLWPGIDGNGGAGGSDVLQAGVEADAYCSGGQTSA